MQENEKEQTKTGSWPEIRGIGENIEENTKDENNQVTTRESEKSQKSEKKD